MFGEIVTRLAGMAEHFCSAVDCVDIGFIADHPLDELLTPSPIGATRVAGIGLSRSRMLSALATVLALAVSPRGFTVTNSPSRSAITGQTANHNTTRRASYDLTEIRGKPSGRGALRSR